MTGFRPTLAAVWRIGAPYFSSEDKWMGRGLLAAVVVIELAVVGLTVLFNRWNATFYNALQERNQDVFYYQIGYFAFLAFIYIALKVYQLYLNQWLQIRWRRWMTSRYFARWLHEANHYRMQLSGDAADNPDQRIAEDTQKFVEQTLALGIGLLSAAVTLASFVVILWGLSDDAPLHVFGRDFAIPGYLVWGRVDLRANRHRADALDRLAAGRVEFPATALRGRLPLQPRAHARECRADRAASRRGCGTHAAFVPLRSRRR